MSARAFASVVARLILIASLPFFASAAPNNPRADREALVTQEHFDQIQNGMTKAQVIEILGPFRSSVSSGGNATFTWYLGTDRAHKIDVHCKDGVVTSKSCSIDWGKHGAAAVVKPAANDPSNKLTRANFEQLKLDMTSAQVKEILGEPSKSESASGGRAGMLWNAGHDYALAMFRDDKLIEMDSSVVPPADKTLNSHMYARLYDGIPEADAVALLGPPTTDDPVGKDKRLTWKDEKLYIVAIFEKGVLKKKTGPKELERPLIYFETTEEDKLTRAIEDLKSGDSKKAGRALSFLAKAPRDEERAPEVSRLIEKCLTSKDSFLKMDARPAMEQWCTKENVPHFISVLERHGKSDARSAVTKEDPDFAIKILTRVRSPEAVPIIARMLERFFDRDTASKALIEMGPELAQAEVMKYANHKDPAVALEARKILEQFKASPAQMLDRDITDLKSPVADKRLWAAQAIEKMEVDPKRRKEVAAALDPLLADKNAWPAHAAASALVKWGTVENEASLIKALSHASPDMRRLACNGLKNVGTKQSIPALQTLVTKPDALHPEVAKAAQEAIAAINGRK